ncbi:MAG: DMT family transporter [Chitinophagaceae bacterium]|nr:MAG: DMT family transporter [Chitinophagaceae bacterium]
MTERDRWINWGLFVLLALIWGSSFILMQIGKDAGLDGIQIGSLRILAAGVVFVPFALVLGRRIPRRKLPLVALSGVLGNLLPAYLFATAIGRVSSALEGILNSLTPLFVVIVGALFFGVRLPRRKLAGVLIGFLGLVALTLKSGFGVSDIGYVLLVLLATLLYGINVNLVNQYLKGLDPIAMATVSLSIVAVPAAFVVAQGGLLSMALHDEAARVGIAASALLGLIGSAVATALFYLLIKRAGGLFASLVTYAIPVVAIGWGLLAGEHISLFQMGCLGIILGGVYLGNKS